jgi:catalase
VSPSKPGKLVKAALDKAVEKVTELVNPPIPGAPNSEPPSLAEPTEPRAPLPPKSDQTGPDTVTPTGAPTGAPKQAFGQQGDFLTTSQGARLYDTDHSLKAGERGPTLLQDHHLREKIMHFDHERIPERVVHARGYGAHGVFVGYGKAAKVCKAAFLGDGVETEVFVRFSTVVGSRGSADTVRDTRGFATKFYTKEGTFDLVGNNIPVFFIQDGIKFPDIIHAGDPAGAERARHVLGLRLPAHRGHPPRDVADVRPRGAPVLPDDGRLRGAHVPAGERGGGNRSREVPLEAQAGRALPDVGGGAADQRRRPRLPPP